MSIEASRTSLETIEMKPLQLFAVRAKCEKGGPSNAFERLRTLTGSDAYPVFGLYDRQTGDYDACKILDWQAGRLIPDEKRGSFRQGEPISLKDGSDVRWMDVPMGTYAMATIEDWPNQLREIDVTTKGLAKLAARDKVKIDPGIASVEVYVSEKKLVLLLPILGIKKP